MAQNESSPNTLAEAIMATVAYFDIFSYPVTAFEVWKWLYWPNQTGPAPLATVIDSLDELVAAGRLSLTTGLYALPERQINLIRARRYEAAERKYRIAARATRWITWLPSVELVAVCNSLGYQNAQPQGDIDFFIIVSDGRLWLTRLLITGLVGAAGLWRHGNKIADRVCLSFYLTDRHLSLADITLTGDDPYLRYWCATVGPLIDRNNMASRFAAANQWIRTTLPNAIPIVLSPRRRVRQSRVQQIVSGLIGRAFSSHFGDWLEGLAQKIQRTKMQRNVRSVAAQPDSRVVISNQMLKFHEADRRQYYRQEWQTRLQQYLS